MVAVRTINSSWPQFHPNKHMVNVVLAAVRAEQDFTGHIEKLYSCSCFITSEGQAVYALEPKMSATASTLSRLEPPILLKKVDSIRSMLQKMMSDSEPITAELFDSIVLDKTKTDSYLRLWYLRLWQALDDAWKHLGQPQQGNHARLIGGKSTPKELKNYRNHIAHWHTSKIDFSLRTDLHLTAMELLRRKYCATNSSS